MSIVTRTGDNGTTGIVGGTRLPKSARRICACGEVDELNAVLGVVLADRIPSPLGRGSGRGVEGNIPLTPPPNLLPQGGGTRSILLKTQHLLFRVGADLATPMHNSSLPFALRQCSGQAGARGRARERELSEKGGGSKAKRIEPRHIEQLESWITAIENALPPLTAFTLPGGTRVSALLHLARAVCRRAEREVVALSEEEEVNPRAQIFLNRLSDLLFLLARRENLEEGGKDVEVEYP